MERSPLAESSIIDPVSDVAGEQLVDLADRAIVAGFDNCRPPVPESSGLHADLQQALGAFVTLNVRGELNGCIGSIEGEDPLGIAVARHAWSAAFADPRLPPLRGGDYAHLEIEVSVLSSLSALPADSRTDLLDALRPGVDGLLIGAGQRRAVFLPSVWDQLPSADVFVGHLFRKAGLAPDVWPGDLRAHRFTAQKIGRRDKRLGTMRGS
jgi:AmmeMemoRadiSam system protein A